MAHVHYWRRLRIIESGCFAALAADVRPLLDFLTSSGICLAGRYGWGQPVVDDHEICFNGPARCTHPAQVCSRASRVAGAGPALPTGGATASRSGSASPGEGNDACAHETFSLPRATLVPNPPTDLCEHMWDSCDTHRKPYDLAVRATLLIAKRHFGGDFVIDVAGRGGDWSDARNLCQRILGYGQDLRLG